MDDAPNRHVRTTKTSGRKPAATPRRGRRLRVALAVAAAALAAFAAVPASQAATGGAGAYEPPAPVAGPTEGAPTASSGELAFGPARWAGASWYGPTLWGNSTACGQTLRRTTIGVAHKTLPCGTTVRFTYHGHSVLAQVIDRGPYVKGRAWDLTEAAAEALDFEGVGLVRYQVATQYARP